MILFADLPVAHRITGPGKPVDNRFGVHLLRIKIDLHQVARRTGSHLLYTGHLGQRLLYCGSLMVTI